MGYDNRFYVVNKSTLAVDVLGNGTKYKYGEIIAMYEYCVDYDLTNFVDKKGRDTDCYIYIDDKETIKDCYGKPLKELTVDELLKYFEENPCFSYRRYAPFMYLLRAFKEIQDDEEGNEKFGNLVVLKYGH